MMIGPQTTSPTVINIQHGRAVELAAL